MPSETPDNLECIEAANRIIAEYYAPNVYHMTDMVSSKSVEGRADLITSVFYDVDLDNVNSPEDLTTGNNWASLDNYSSGETGDIDALDPYVYYSVVWTKDYWLVAYGFYHPRDWAGNGWCCGGTSFGSDSHENDYEGAVFVIDRNTFTLKGAVSTFHKELLKYSTTEHDLTNNPNVFIDDRTHAVVMNLTTGECIEDVPNIINCDGCKEFNLGDLQNHVLYMPVQGNEEPYVNTTRLDDIIDVNGSPLITESRLYGEGKYILEDVFGSHEYSLNNQRNNSFVFTGASRGSFYAATEGDCLGTSASAPWAWGNFKHTRRDIEKAVCFAETGDYNCYEPSVENISSTPWGPVGQIIPVIQWPLTIEYNPYFPEQCGENMLEPMFIYEDTNWDFPEDLILNDIVIDFGVRLTVIDRTLLFAPGRGIRLKYGAELITSNATFDVCPEAALVDEKWRGIHAPNSTNDPIRITLTNGTTIKNADNGLLLGYRSRGINGGFSPTVALNDAHFIDNNIGVHSFDTDQVHQFAFCSFINNNIGISLLEGVEGLDIFETNFADNDIGVSAMNSSVNLMFNNTFDGGRIGVFVGATNPLESDVTIGSPSSDFGSNTFTNLERGVLAMGGGATTGLTIINNTFTDIRENAVQIRGESSFTIANNSFGDDELGGNRRGVEVVGSGSEINRIQCNIFTQNEVVDNVLSGINNNTRFLENDYSTDAQFKNITFAAILPDMGSAALSAANCFNDDAGITPDIARIFGNDFTYFYKNTSECQEQEPNGLSNVIKDNANDDFNGCNGLIGPFNFIDPGNGGQVDINNFDVHLVCEPCILDSIDYYKNQIIANGGNNPETGNASVDTPTTGLVKSEQIFEQWVNFGLFVANKKKDYNFAENILFPLNDWKWKIKYYGLSLQKEDFSEATNRLASLPNTNNNEAAFKRTQEINLKYLMAKGSGTETNITDENIETLREIGLSYEPSNGYARTLLFLLTGEELPTSIPELEEYIETAVKAKEKEEEVLSTIPNKTISIFPNPAKDYIQIESENEPISQIILSDIYGKRVTLKKGNDHTIRIETIGIETGIYLIQVQLANGKLISKKIIIDN